MLGNYAVEMVVDGEAHRQVFKVQDYRKPDYQVQVTPERTRYVAGETVTVTVESRYFFGEPVANAPLEIKIYRLGERWCWEGECPTEEKYVWYASDRPPIQATTDASGRFTFTLTAEYQSDDRWWWPPVRTLWGLEATVDDGSHQTVSHFAVVEVFRTAERLSLDVGGHLHPPGQPFTVQITARTIFDEPVPGRAIRLELARWSLATSDYTDIVQAITLTTRSDGTVSTPLTPKEPGWYRLRAVATDRLGNDITESTWLAVFSQDWRGQPAPGQLRIVADQPQYAPGDIARLLIESSVGGPALLTFERGTTRRAQLVTLTPPLTLVDVPIQPDDVPNIHVTVNVWEPQDTTLGPKGTQYSLSDSVLRTASVELAVPATDRRLTVTITPDRTRYAPRQQATFTVRVTDAQGAPVPGAEVSLALVDEAIFALSDELSGPIHDAFYDRRANIVRTYNGMALRRYIGEDGMGGGGGEGGPSPGNPRSDFPDTAIWLPALTTDADGTVVLTLNLPDSLTTWRLTAKVTTAEDQVRVGEAVAKVTTHQPVVVRPLLPRALTAGDQFYLSAAVHNYSPSAQTLVVEVRPEGGLEVARPLTQTVSLAPGEVRIVGWSAQARAAGTVTVTVGARSATARRRGPADHAGAPTGRPGGGDPGRRVPGPLGDDRLPAHRHPEIGQFPGSASFPLRRREHPGRPGVSDRVSLRLCGADDEQGAADGGGGPRLPPVGLRQPDPSGRPAAQSPGGSSAALRLPAQRRRLGVVVGRRQPRLPDRLGGLRPHDDRLRPATKWTPGVVGRGVDWLNGHLNEMDIRTAPTPSTAWRSPGRATGTQRWPW